MVKITNTSERFVAVFRPGYGNYVNLSPKQSATVEGRQDDVDFFNQGYGIFGIVAELVKEEPEISVKEEVKAEVKELKASNEVKPAQRTSSKGKGRRSVKL